jgi:hypothetical protein
MYNRRLRLKPPGDISHADQKEGSLQKEGFEKGCEEDIAKAWCRPCSQKHEQKEAKQEEGDFQEENNLQEEVDFKEEDDLEEKDDFEEEAGFQEEVSDEKGGQEESLQEKGSQKSLEEGE